MPTMTEGSADAQQRSMPPNEALHNLQDDAKALFDTAREQGSEHLEEYRERAADEIENLARTATSAAEQLQDDDTLGLSHYITDVADGLSSFAGSLRGKSADELLQQVGRLARDNPALFLTGSIALGFGLSRFMRASAPGIAQTGARDSTGKDFNAQDAKSEQANSGTQLAAKEEPGVRPAHEDDLVRSQSKTPSWSTASPSTTDKDDESGIQQSGAEMGSFAEPNDNASSPVTPYPGSTDKPVIKGEL
jgi:hypothetical protein